MRALTIAGRIGKNAETRTTTNGKKVTGFSVAVDDRSSQDAPAFWFDCAIWGERGVKLAQYLTKGSNVTVSGELTRREHEGKTYLGVNVNDVTLQGGKPDSGQQSQQGGYNGDPAQSSQGSTGGGYGGGIDDDVPFTFEWRG